METLYVQNRQEWRAWLKRHSGDTPEVWLLYYKKASGRPRVSQADAVEEALCFGWIDGKIKKVDEASYAQRFTPRGAKSQWSALNIARARRLIKEGKMTPAGREAFRSHAARKTPPQPTELPAELEQKFMQRPEAWENYNRFPPSYLRMTAGWVAGAKREETRLKRLSQLMAAAAENRRIRFM
jgi:uncharacterized protein YdeI (YjbR/CyaY-like superfamily)